MPFTVSHVAAILPATRFPWLRDPLVISALAIGSMSPDVPYFVPMDFWWAFGHQWSGLWLQDVPVTVALVVGYWAVLAAPLRELAPDALRRRLPTGVLARHRAAPGRALVLVVAGAAVGAATHIVWDAFTHEDRFGVMAVPWLQVPSLLGPLPAYRVLQYASSIVGLALLVWSVLRWYRSAPSSKVLSPGLGNAWRAAFVLGVLTAAVAGWWSVRGLAGQATDLYGLRALLYAGLTHSVALMAVVVLAAALAIRVRPRRMAQPS